MKLDVSQFLFSISKALDAVENEILGAAENHGKRIAIISVLIGKKLNLSKEELMDLASNALLHDNALTEYMAVENQKGNFTLQKENLNNMEFHCIQGEKNLEVFPLCYSHQNIILYHHENYNGTGLFQKEKEQIPLAARIIRIADQTDVMFDFSTINQDKLAKLKTHLKHKRGIDYDPNLVDIFLSILDDLFFEQLSSEQIGQALELVIPHYIISTDYKYLLKLSTLFAHIIDYKSRFTMNHSSGIAEKAKKIAGFYQLSEEETDKLTIAALLHDIGKLTVPNRLLDKPGKLTDKEFEIIKKHVFYTYEILSPIENFQQIALWASSHHERLDGTGYFRGSKGKELDFNSRLLACIDVYQALVEERPYRKGMTHQDAVHILREQALAGKLDNIIVEDLNQFFLEFS